MFLDGPCDPGSPSLVLPCRHGFLRLGSTLSGRTRLSPPGFRLFSHPFRGPFQLSLTVLVRYRSRDVFSLGSWCLPTSRAKTKARYSGSQPSSCRLTPTGLSPSTAGLSRPFRLNQRGGSWSLTPHPPRVSPRRSVWAPPLSVAPTRGIPVGFFSSPY